MSSKKKSKPRNPVIREETVFFVTGDEKPYKTLQEAEQGMRSAAIGQIVALHYTEGEFEWDELVKYLTENHEDRELFVDFILGLEK